MLSSIQIRFDKIQNHTTNKISINMPTDITIYDLLSGTLQYASYNRVASVRSWCRSGQESGVAREHGKTYLAVGVLGWIACPRPPPGWCGASRVPSSRGVSGRVCDRYYTRTVSPPSESVRDPSGCAAAESPSRTSHICTASHRCGSFRDPSDHAAAERSYYTYSSGADVPRCGSSRGL